MKEKLYRFMQGRYGNDKLNQLLLVLILIIWVLSLFTWDYLWVISLLLLILVYYRMFSRNIARRSAENRFYLEKTARIRNFFKGQWYRLSQSKQYHIYKCPSCGQKIRIPRGKGHIMVRCPKCATEFQKNS